MYSQCMHFQTLHQDSTQTYRQRCSCYSISTNSTEDLSDDRSQSNIKHIQQTFIKLRLESLITTAMVIGNHSPAGHILFYWHVLQTRPIVHEQLLALTSLRSGRCHCGKGTCFLFKLCFKVPFTVLVHSWLSTSST